jgi:predicted metalloprotease with PDZ domain
MTRNIRKRCFKINFLLRKRPLVGWIVDLAIRNVTDNQKSLDNVMSYLYHYYYKNSKEASTDAEFRRSL